MCKKINPFAGVKVEVNLCLKCGHCFFTSENFAVLYYYSEKMVVGQLKASKLKYATASPMEEIMIS